MKPVRLTVLTGLVTLQMVFNLANAEEFSFNVSAYEKKPYEFNGHFDLMATQLNINPNSALSNLAFKPPAKPQDFQRYNSELELNGLYRFDKSSLNFRSLSLWQDDILTQTTEHTLQEGFWRYQPSNQWSFDLGKRAIKWGKGYAWNPVGFLERAKNPDDPEINREGFILAGGEYTKSLPGLVKTVSAAFFAIPVSDTLNEDFSSNTTESLFFGGKLYLLVADTDIDFYLRHSAETNTDYGMSFATNLATNFELHGDFAYRDQVFQTQITDTPSLASTIESTFQSLVGIRYLTTTDLTWIVEWLHNPQGYSTNEMTDFYSLAKSDPDTSPLDYQLAQQAKQGSYSLSNSRQNYLYIKASQKDFADIVYLNSALTLISNLEDSSYLLTPELIYTGYKNSELRFRATTFQGSNNSEFAEKLTDLKLEFRARVFF
ncbi:hypothetical protein [Thiomicrorhabdus sp. Kp2]|uniref:hypothetical protein n=1 Tax=Thiomicrorhabdus sp. Kp2 TaxID=1123518 RepID=UPI0004074FBE|nr:hypothetical protein [Thiomicrorhabdus sp. Kp2]